MSIHIRVNSHSKYFILLYLLQVIDFELFQAVHGHTNEVLHGLFTGKLFPPNATLKEKAVSEFGKFFGKFEESGYHTLYNDDMCYDKWWGI